MTTAIKEDSRTAYREESAWLYRLLADIRQETTRQPTSQAIMRIRTRLLDEMKTPTKAAA